MQPEGFQLAHRTTRCNEPNKAGDWEKPALIYQGQIMPTNLITFYNKITSSVDTGRAVDVV